MRKKLSKVKFPILSYCYFPSTMDDRPLAFLFSTAINEQIITSFRPEAISREEKKAKRQTAEIQIHRRKIKMEFCLAVASIPLLVASGPKGKKEKKS